MPPLATAVRSITLVPGGYLRRERTACQYQSNNGRPTITSTTDATAAISIQSIFLVIVSPDKKFHKHQSNPQQSRCWRNQTPAVLDEIGKKFPSYFVQATQTVVEARQQNGNLEVGHPVGLERRPGEFRRAEQVHSPTH